MMRILSQNSSSTKTDNKNKNSSNKKGTSSNKDNKKSSWKYNCKLSISDIYEKDDKTYHWCSCPGHGNISMWTIHTPGTCTTDNSSNKKQSSTDKGNKNKNNEQKDKLTVLTSLLDKAINSMIQMLQE